MSITFYPKGKMGIDGNCPINIQTGAIASQLSNPATVASTGTAFVRLNFVLGPWKSPSDSTTYSGRTWRQTYDTLVDGLLNHGVEIYALVGSEATSRPDPGNRFRQATPNSDAEDWLQEYTNNFKAIATRYADRIKVFESFNEPNDWHGGTTNLLHPYWFARLLKQVYTVLKVDTRLPITLVSGPLLSHDLPGGGDDGSFYLDLTYRLGRVHHGWENFLTDHGTYPLDDIGYHLYVAERQEATSADIESTYDRHLDAIWTVIRRYESDLTGKGVHLSEYGWTSDHGEDKQAQRIRTGFRLLRDRFMIKTATLFCIQDFPGKAYGIFRQGNLTAGNRKQAYEAFVALIAEGGPKVQIGYDSTGNRYPTIVAAYERHGGQATVGVPFDNGRGQLVYRWGSGVAQEFKTAAGDMSIILQKDGTSKAYLLNGMIRHRYLYTYGGPTGQLGYPTADQGADEWKMPRATFEGGRIICRTILETQG